MLVNTIRDNTRYKSVVEIKKVYRHPLYKAPSLYNDLAIGEFGRRLEYDFDKFGDSPNCLYSGDEDIEGQVATVQVKNHCKIYKIKPSKNMLYLNIQGLWRR